MSVGVETAQISTPALGTQVKEERMDVKDLAELESMLTARVEKGVAYLNEHHRPDWVHIIDVDDLDLNHACNCVLGQLAIDMDLPNSSAWMNEGFDVYLKIHSLTLSEATAMGFYLPEYEQVTYFKGTEDIPNPYPDDLYRETYSVLTDIWVSAINRERKEKVEC